MLATAWEYFRVSSPPDLETLGAESWELVAIRGEEWIFKRPAPDPAKRFTHEQRAAALADPTAHASDSRHLLNPEIAALIRRVNHTQMLLIADRGYPLPLLPWVVDLSLTADVPTVNQVIAAVMPDLPADRFIVAEELREASLERWGEYRIDRRVEAVPHFEFKAMARHAVGCIRTGDSTPYSNVLVVGG